MAETASLSGCGAGNAERPRLLTAVADSFRRHYLLHAVALTTLLLALVVGRATGNLPDFAVLTSYFYHLAIAFWIGGCLFAIVRFGWLALVERDPEPIGAFLRSFVTFFGNTDRVVNGLNGLAAMIVFISGFSVLKGAIAILQPFSWDLALANADRALHFGVAPHTWFWWLLSNPALLRGINIAYNAWFFVLVAMIFNVVYARTDTALRHQFLMTFMLIWLIGGFFVAMGFSSAGPCYFGPLGLGDDYQPLMDALGWADDVLPVWALTTQDILWSGYTGETSGSIGISAFPSMHVASSVLFALYASRRSAIAGAVAWAFAGVIMIGSVVLAWHYAVDGYAGAALTVLIWKAVGRYYASLEGRAESPISPQTA